MKSASDIVTDRRLTLQLVNDHLATLTADGPAYLLGEHHVVASGGSSGMRGVFVWDFEGWLSFALVRERSSFWLDRHVARTGESRRAWVAAAHASHPTAILARTFSGSPQLGVNRSFPVTLSLTEIVAGLNEFRPTYLFAYPSMLHVLALEALHGYDTGIDVSRIYEVSQLVERLSGIPIGVGKPLVGHNAFAHESGIHAHGVLKHTATYEPIQPETIGRTRTFVFGKHTGSQAVGEKLRTGGVEATHDQVAELVRLIKDFAEARSKSDQQAFIASFRGRVERQRGVTDEEFWTLAKTAGLAAPKPAAK